MKKWIIMTILIVMLAFPAFAIDIQIGLDNATWNDIAIKSESGRYAYEDNLDEDTLYYLRYRENSTQNWTYFTQRTKTSGEITMNDLAIVGTLLGFGLLLIVLGVYLFMRNGHND